MTQGSLLAVSERTELTPERLIDALRGRGWLHRHDVALLLSVSTRAVREAANQSCGAILSGPQGLRLTVEATEHELETCLGFFTSQIREMSKRVVETRYTWEHRTA